MAKKELNAEEIVELRESPFISSIISGRISFAPEFKCMAYSQLVSGKSMREIFEENCIDPDILGSSHIWGFAQKLRIFIDKMISLTVVQHIKKISSRTRYPTCAFAF